MAPSSRASLVTSFISLGSILGNKKTYFHLYSCVHICAIVRVMLCYVCRQQAGQKRGLDSPELEFQKTLSQLSWVLGTDPRSSARAAPLQFLVSLLLKGTLIAVCNPASDGYSGDYSISHLEGVLLFSSYH